MRVIIAFILIGSLVAAVLGLYTIELNRHGYDIYMMKKRNPSEGFGVRYKNTFEVWRFGVTSDGGRFSSKIIPFAEDREMKRKKEITGMIEGTFGR